MVVVVVREVDWRASGMGRFLPVFPLPLGAHSKESPQVATRASGRDQRARLPPSGGIGQNGPLVECLVDTKQCLIWLSLQPGEGGAHKGPQAHKDELTCSRRPRHGSGFELGLAPVGPRERPQASLSILTLVQEEQDSWTGLSDSLLVSRLPLNVQAGPGSKQTL